MDVPQLTQILKYLIAGLVESVEKSLKKVENYMHRYWDNFVI